MWRALIAAAAAVAIAGVAPAADARIPLPTGNTYIALDGPGTAIGDDDLLVCGDTCALSLSAVPLDGSAPTPLGTVPLTGVDCPGGDPNYSEDSIQSLAAANEGRVLVFDNQSGCGPPPYDAGQWYAGPYAGPIAPVAFPACTADGIAYAVSSSFEARACGAGGTTQVSVVAAAGGPPVRSYDFPTPTPTTTRLALAGNDLAIDRETGTTAHVTVTDVSSGTQLYAFSASAPLSLAIADDGTVVTSPAPGGNPACAGMLASHTPAAPVAHPLPYQACGQVYLSAGELIFEHPRSDGFTSVERLNLATSAVQPMTTFSRRGTLETADASHVIARDQDCRSRETVYAAPGGGADTPGPRKCPIAFAAGRVHGTFNLLDGTLEIKLPISCPHGCPAIRYFMARDARTYVSDERFRNHGVVAKIHTTSRILARRCRRYRAGKAKPPVVNARIRGSNRDGTTTLKMRRLHVALRFINR